MAINVYISGICGSQEVRKQQQRVLFILQGMPIDLHVIDITEPGKDVDLVYMQDEAKKNGKDTQRPPQIFNGTDYCGDYVDFELANDEDRMMQFLKLEAASTTEGSITQNGVGQHDKEETDLGLAPVSNDLATENTLNEDDVESTEKEEKKPEDEGLVIENTEDIFDKNQGEILSPEVAAEESGQESE